MVVQESCEELNWAVVISGCSTLELHIRLWLPPVLPEVGLGGNTEQCVGDLMHFKAN